MGSTITSILLTSMKRQNLTNSKMQSSHSSLGFSPRRRHGLSDKGSSYPTNHNMTVMIHNRWPQVFTPLLLSKGPDHRPLDAGTVATSEVVMFAIKDRRKHSSRDLTITNTSSFSFPSKPSPVSRWWLPKPHSMCLSLDALATIPIRCCNYNPLAWYELQRYPIVPACYG